jgi:transcription antitermination factor NusG
MSDWFVWTINQQRYKKVLEFLENLDTINDFFYPTVEKEYDTKSGKKHMDVPLYSNYIFIKHDDNVFLRESILKCAWIKDCLGPCSQQEINKIIEASGKKYSDLIPKTGVVVGESYRLKGTVFNGMHCTVVSMDDNRLTVSVELFGSERFIRCNIDDINLEG